MEANNKSSKKTWATPRKKRNLNKRRKSEHKFQMSKKQLKEFFGHSFGQVLGGGIELPYEIHVFYGKRYETIPVTLVSDKNHGLMNIKCEYQPKKAAQEDVDAAIIRLLGMNRGINVNILCYEGGY